MKNYILKSVSSPVLERFPTLRKRLAATSEPLPVCLGADLEKAGVCVAAQVGLGTPISLGLLSREETSALVATLVQKGHRVAVGVEACGFGWRWQEQLRQTAATVYTFAPEPLTGRRKTNRRDAAALALLTSDRFVHDNKRAGRVVREPSPLEQQRRFLTRHRSHLVALRGKLEAHGRGLLLDFGRLDYPDCWWGKKMWPRLVAQLQASGEEWLLAELTRQRRLTCELHQEIRTMDTRLAALSDELLPDVLPGGLGELTALMLFVEVMNWNRFSNRKQAGSYIGCCPTEHSTGPGQRLGAIDRQGNRRLRSALTETVWRLTRWEKDWRGFAKWGALLQDKNVGGVRRKKAVIACVRLLFIDLWRLHTGRATLAELGFHGRNRKAPEEAAEAIAA